MSAKRITMRKIRDILRLRYAGALSIRQIRASTKVSLGAIQKLLAKAEEHGLSWPLAPELDDRQLARLFYPGADTVIVATLYFFIGRPGCVLSSVCIRQILFADREPAVT